MISLIKQAPKVMREEQHVQKRGESRWAGYFNRSLQEQLKIRVVHLYHTLTLGAVFTEADEAATWMHFLFSCSKDE